MTLCALVAAALPATAEPPVPTGTIADAFWGVNDLNDGWVHVITPRNPVNVYGAEQAFRADANGDFVIDVESWYLGAVGELPYRLKIGDPTLFPHVSVAFARQQEVFFGTQGQYATPSTDQKTMTVRIPVSALEAAGGDLGDSFTIWASVFYVPRNPDTGQLNSGGSPTRADHGVTNPECYATPATAPWKNCPESGGFFSVPKNLAFTRGFGGQDRYANEGGSADGTPYGTNDALVALLGGTSSSPQAELGLKGQVDRMEWLPSLARITG